MTKKSLWLAGLGALLFLFCHRLWGLGITHTDDAIWLLASHENSWRLIVSTAVEQGRVWVFLALGLVYTAFSLHGTMLGEVMGVGALAVFFVLFHRVAGLYFGARIALLAATLNLAFFALRWDSSIAAAYPGIFWIAGSLFPCAVWCGWHYSREGHRRHGIAALALLFVSLFVHEGVTVLFLGLFALSIAANDYGQNPSEWTLRRLWTTRRCQWLSVGTVVVAMSYFALYFAWRYLHPSIYEGNMPGTLSPQRVLPVILSFATKGTLLADLVKPYTVTFTDAVKQDGVKAVYAASSYFNFQGLEPLALIHAAIVFAMALSLLVVNGKDSQGFLKPVTTVKALGALGAGGMIALLPVLPVAVVNRYQQWHFDLGVQAYADSALCHFGVALGLAAMFAWLCAPEKRGVMARRALALMLATGIGALSYGGFRMNDAMAKDIRVETSRWAAVDRAVALSELSGIDQRIIYAPRLQSGSWYTVVEPVYWSQYVAAFHKKALTFVTRPTPAMIQGAADAALLDYSLVDNHLVVMLARLSGTSDKEQIADSIALAIDSPMVADLQHTMLVFRDRKRGVVTHRLADMPQLGNNFRYRIIKNVEAAPSSITLTRFAPVPSLPKPCGADMTSGTKIIFGTAFPDSPHACDGSAMLRDGWNEREAGGLWSKARKATIVLPTAGLHPGALRLDLLAATYVGLGFSEGTQAISLQVGDKVLSHREDKKSDGPKPLVANLAATDWAPGQNINLTLAIDHTINPAQLGNNPDVRDLGLYLYTLSMHQKSEDNEQQ